MEKRKKKKENDIRELVARCPNFGNLVRYPTWLDGSTSSQSFYVICCPTLTLYLHHFTYAI